MAKLRFHQKEQKVLRFLQGALHAQVVARLRDRGFTEAVHEQGQELLAKAVRTRSAVKPRVGDTERLVPRIEDLEKAWVPVAQASLEVRFPQVYEELFHGYQRTTGVDVILMMRLFVERLRALREKTDEESRAAIALLAERGLTDEVDRAVEALLAQAMVPARPAEAHRADALEAETAMWRFYIEWSRIARTVVKERALRRALGFRDNRAGDPEMPEAASVGVTPAAPEQAAPGP